MQWSNASSLKELHLDLSDDIEMTIVQDSLVSVFLDNLASETQSFLPRLSNLEVLDLRCKFDDFQLNQLLRVVVERFQNIQQITLPSEVFQNESKYTQINRTDDQGFEDSQSILQKFESLNQLRKITVPLEGYDLVDLEQNIVFKIAKQNQERQINFEINQQISLQQLVQLETDKSISPYNSLQFQRGLIFKENDLQEYSEFLKLYYPQFLSYQSMCQNYEEKEKPKQVSIF
eukprot:403338140